jgi:hypothetical protein
MTYVGAVKGGKLKLGSLAENGGMCSNKMLQLIATSIDGLIIK